MRIAVFIKRTTFHEGYGGLETQNKVLCEGLAERGYDITVFAPQRELKITSKTENSVDYVFIPSVFRSLFSSFMKNHWYNRSYKVFKQAHEKQKFDLVISQSSAGIAVIKHKDELDVPVISVAHGSVIMEITTRLQSIANFISFLKLIPDVGYSLLLNFFFKQRQFILCSDKVIAVSNFVKDALISETFIKPDRVVVINNGVNAVRIPKESKKSDTKKLLYVGQVHKNKGSDLLFKLFKDPHFSDHHLDVVGSGEYLKTFRKLLTENEISNISLHGKITNPEELWKFYKSVDLFVFPTRRQEGFPMVLAEAMLCGLPIVAFNCGGVADAIDNNETGFLVKPGDFNDFKDKVLTLLNDPILSDSMSKKALEKARKEFTIEHMLDKYETIIKEFMK